MIHLTVRHDSETKLYHAEVFDGPDGINCARFSCFSLGEVFEKVTVFVTLNGLTYCESLEDGIKSYFRGIDEK